MLAISVPTEVSHLISSYQGSIPAWTQAMRGPALFIFTALTTLDLGWAFMWMIFDRHDWLSILGIVCRKLMIAAIFFTIMLNYGWSKVIVESFKQLGNVGAGISVVSPGDIVSIGVNLCGSLLSAADSAGNSWNFGTALVMAISSIAILLSFAAITFTYMVALVEGYLALACGQIFLGFGGASFTRAYTDRYIGLAVAIGIKFMCIFFLIGVGMKQVAQWQADAISIESAPEPAKVVFSILVGSVLFMMLCWHIPKFFATVIGGSPNMTGGDFVSTAIYGATMSVAAGALGKSMATMAAGAIGGSIGGAGGSAGAGGGSPSGGGGGSRSGGTGGSSTPTDVPPPSGGSGGGGSSSGGSRGGSRGRTIVVPRPPSDNHHAPAPPSLMGKG